MTRLQKKEEHQVIVFKKKSKNKENVSALKYLHMSFVGTRFNAVETEKLNDVEIQNVNMWCTAQTSVDENGEMYVFFL